MAKQEKTQNQSNESLAENNKNLDLDKNDIQNKFNKEFDIDPDNIAKEKVVWKIDKNPNSVNQNAQNKKTKQRPDDKKSGAENQNQ